MIAASRSWSQTTWTGEADFYQGVGLDMHPSSSSLSWIVVGDLGSMGRGWPCARTHKGGCRCITSVTSLLAVSCMDEKHGKCLCSFQFLS